MRTAAIALVLLSLSCSMTHSSSSPFAKPDDSVAPAGLDLSVVSVAPDGKVVLELRNYSIEPFVFSGTPENPRLEIEFEAENGNFSRHKFVPWKAMRNTYEVPAGERVKIQTTMFPGEGGRVRVGLRSRDFGFIVWSETFSLY